MGLIFFVPGMLVDRQSRMIPFRKNVGFRKQILQSVGFRHYKGKPSMGRISVGSVFMIAAFGMAAGCSSFSTSRFNLFNHNRGNECCPDVGTGPVCEGSIMGGERMPSDGNFLPPNDAGFMPGAMLPGTGTVPGTIIQQPPNFMPPASVQSTTPPPGRLIQAPPLKPMPSAQGP